MAKRATLMSLAVFLLSWFFAGCATTAPDGTAEAAAEPTVPSESAPFDASYLSLLGRYAAGESVPMADLRGAYVESELYDPLDMELAEALVELFGGGDPAAAAALAEEWHDRFFPDMEYQFFAMAANDFCGNDQAAAYHEKALREILDVVYASGDGMGPDTAYFVIAVREEYRLMYFNSLVHGPQSLMDVEGSFFDVFDIEPTESYPGTRLWFNVDLLFDYYDGIL